MTFMFNAPSHDEQQSVLHSRYLIRTYKQLTIGLNTKKEHLPNQKIQVIFLDRKEAFILNRTVIFINYPSSIFNQITKN